MLRRPFLRSNVRDATLLASPFPYLAGSLFHTQPHAAYDRSFHAKAVTNGTKAATCLDCHTKDGDLTTMLPASDPNSPINGGTLPRPAASATGDKSVMQGTGISDRPFLSYRESVHAKAIALGNTSAAVCSDCHNSHDIQMGSIPSQLEGGRAAEVLILLGRRFVVRKLQHLLSCRFSVLSGRSERAGCALAAAHAHGYDAVARFTALHFVGHRSHQAWTGRAKRMADRIEPPLTLGLLMGTPSRSRQ